MFFNYFLTDQKHLYVYWFLNFNHCSLVVFSPETDQAEEQEIPAPVVQSTRGVFKATHKRFNHM